MYTWPIDFSARAQRPIFQREDVETALEPEQDNSFLELVGKWQSGICDVSENHDKYIAEYTYEKIKRDPESCRTS